MNGKIYMLKIILIMVVIVVVRKNIVKRIITVLIHLIVWNNKKINRITIYFGIFNRLCFQKKDRIFSFF